MTLLSMMTVAINVTIFAFFINIPATFVVVVVGAARECHCTVQFKSIFTLLCDTDSILVSVRTSMRYINLHYLSIYLSIHLSIYPSIHPSIHPSIFRYSVVLLIYNVSSSCGTVPVTPVVDELNIPDSIPSSMASCVSEAHLSVDEHVLSRGLR